MASPAPEKVSKKTVSVIVSGRFNLFNSNGFTKAVMVPVSQTPEKEWAKPPSELPLSFLPSTSIPASSSHPGRPSTLTPASTQHLGGGVCIATDPYTCGGAAKSVSKKATLGFSFLGLYLKFGPLVLLWPKTRNFNLSFRFSPRSENSIANDLCKESHMVYDQAHLCSL